MSSNVIKRLFSLMDGRSASTAAIQTFVVKVCILAINMGTGIITARVLGTQGRGEMAAATLWPQLLAFAMTLGIPQALVYNVKKYPEKKSQLFSAAVVLSTGLGFLASLVGILFLPTWLSQYSLPVIRASQWFMLISPVLLLNLVFTRAFEARDEFTVSNQLRYLIPLTTLISLLLMIGFNLSGPIMFGMAYALPAIPISIWMFVRLRSRYDYFQLTQFREASNLLLKYGSRAYGIDLIGALAGQIGQAIVAGMLNAASMGLYVVALSLARMLNTFAAAIEIVLLPKTSARPVPEIVALTAQAVRISTMLTLLCLLPLMFLGPFFLGVLYGQEFVAATTVFRILLISHLIHGMNWLLAKSFMAAGKPGVVTLLQGLGLGITIPLMLVLIPRYGLVGAGIALLVSTSTRFFLVMSCYPLILKVPPPSLIVNLDDIRYLQKLFLKRS